MCAWREIKWVMVASVLWPAAIVAVTPAVAQNEPVLVIPGRPGVPVLMYGIDVSGAVIEGEFGLNRPGQVAPTVILPYVPQPILSPPGGYFPATGQRPRVGRLERIPPPNRPLPQPAEPFFRSWGIESEPSPATVPVPNDPPAIVVAPQIGSERRDRRTYAPQPAPSPTAPPQPAPKKPNLQP